MMNQTVKGVLALLQQALWSADTSIPGGADIAAIYKEMRGQSVSEVADKELMEICPEGLRRRWQIAILSQLSHNEVICSGQNQLLCLLKAVGIPAVILKGAAAAQYYPRPENRAMGDVDILVRQEDFPRARELMTANGFVQSKPEQPGDCLISFEKDGIEYELHRRLRWDADKQLEETLNTYISDGFTRRTACRHGIYSVPVLPNPENGLVLLWHLRRHMDSGLGLRQILDWMLYVQCCLDDEAWQTGFRQRAEACGLDKLAITVTAMCCEYLGLPIEQHSWCLSADKRVCRDLLEYVFYSGTFGSKIEHTSRSAALSVVRVSGVGGRLKRMQEAGLNRWPAAQRYDFLRPFAWVMQLRHYMNVIFSRKKPIQNLYADYQRGKRMRRMLDEMGISNAGRQQ